MCDAVHMHKQLMFVNIYNTVTAHDSIRVLKTVGIVNTRNAYNLCLDMLNGQGQPS